MINIILDCSSKGDRRYYPGDITVSIQGKTDTIDGFFNGSLRNRLGEVCSFSEADHLEFNGVHFPLEFAEEFYISLWLQRIRTDRFLQTTLLKYDDFHDGRKDGVNSHARVFRIYKQGGKKFLRAKCSRFLAAYGKKGSGFGDSTIENIEPQSSIKQSGNIFVFPEWEDICDTARYGADIAFEKEVGRGGCKAFRIKVFQNAKLVEVYDLERIRNMIENLVFAYYDHRCGNVTDGYVRQYEAELGDEYRKIAERYSQG